MSTTNEVARDLSPAPSPDGRSSSYASSHQYATANAPQHNGDNVNYTIHNYGNNQNGSARLPGNAHAENSRRVLPRLPQVRNSQALEMSRSASQSPVSRSGSATRQNFPRRHSLRSCLHRILSYTIFAVLIACIILAIVLTFGTRELSIDQTPGIRHGFFESWIDYSQAGIRKRKITLSASQAELVASVAVLTLGSTIPRAHILLVRTSAKLFEKLVRWIRCSHKALSRSLSRRGTIQINRLDPEANEETPLMQISQQEHTWSQIYEICKTSTSIKFYVIGFVNFASYRKWTSADQRGGKYYIIYAGRVALGLFFLLLAIAAFFVLVLVAISAASIATDTTVLSNHPDCGVWVRKAKIHTPSSTGYDYLQEREAAEYARNCYHKSSGADGCNEFLTPKIPYSTNSHCQCPFEDKLCLDGRFSAYTLKTGTAASNFSVSSKYLGINVEHGYSFQRMTTCSPVQQQAELSEDGTAYEYDYGPASGFGNLTWRSSSKPDWSFSGYNVAIFYYKQHASLNNWEPRPEFKPSEHQAITLLLIQSQKNYHATPQYDPIFPAERSMIPAIGRAPLYFNDEPIATALACVDSTVICDTSGQVCFADKYHPSPELPGEAEEIGYYMLLQALVDSSISQAIQLLGSRALIAEAKLEHEFSLPLAKDQWKVEAENLFIASLVRAQIALRDYVRGTAAHDPEYQDRTQGGMHEMCQAYTFPGRGWRNVTVWGMVLVFFAALLIWVLTIKLSIPTNNFSLHIERSNSQSTINFSQAQFYFVGEWIFDKVFALFDGKIMPEDQEPPPDADEQERPQTLPVNIPGVQASFDFHSGGRVNIDGMGSLDRNKQLGVREPSIGSISTQQGAVSGED